MLLLLKYVLFDFQLTTNSDKLNSFKIVVNDRNIVGGCLRETNNPYDVYARYGSNNLTKSPSLVYYFISSWPHSTMI